MTDLVCRALNCVNNHSRLCCLEEIEVGGRDAEHAQETCCGSFADESRGYSNMLDSREAEPETHIVCEAQRCIYNAEGVCSAGDVQIDGSAAHRRMGTSCETFLARD